jgi:hypothetical protein
MKDEIAFRANVPFGRRGAVLVKGDRMPQDGDFVATPKGSGRYRIGRWSASRQRAEPLPEYDDVPEAELEGIFDTLREDGDTFIEDRPGIFRLVQPA